MKKILVVALAVAIALMGASAAMAAVAGSKHDLSTAGAGAANFVAAAQMNNEVCVFCHTPHGASASAALWNRTLDSAGYTMYGATLGYDSSANTYAPTAQAGGPRTKTLLCMSCHDGVSGIGGAVINTPGPGSTPTPNTTGEVITGTYTNIGKDLSNDHPVSIPYVTAGGKAGLRALTNVANYPDDVARVQNATTVAANTGATSYVECVSCHDPHNSAASTYTVAFLRINNNGSNLCYSCHSGR